MAPSWPPPGVFSLLHLFSKQHLECIFRSLIWSFQSFASVFSSVTQSCLTLFYPMDCSTPGFPVHHQLLELAQLMSISQWGHPTISSSVVPFSSWLQSFPASVFSNRSALHITWPKYRSFSFSISPSKKYSGLISFRIDWFDLLAVQGTLNTLVGLFSNTTVQKHQFFGTQLSL